jgi:hypothetical protein
MATRQTQLLLRQAQIVRMLRLGSVSNDKLRHTLRTRPYLRHIHASLCQLLTIRSTSASHLVCPTTDVFLSVPHDPSISLMSVGDLDASAAHYHTTIFQ